MQSTRYYSPEEWRDTETRKNAIIEARKDAREIGKVVLKVRDGRRQWKVFEIAYVELRNGFIVNRY